MSTYVTYLWPGLPLGAVPDGGLPSMPSEDIGIRRVAFYLLPADASAVIDRGSMIILPHLVEHGGINYLLGCGSFDGDEHDAISDACPQPEGWSGTPGEAQRLMREKDLINWWWLFDQFIWLADEDADNARGYRGL